MIPLAVLLSVCKGVAGCRFFQGHANGADGLSIEEKVSQFCLCSARCYLAHDLTKDVNWSIARQGRAGGSVVVGVAVGQEQPKTSSQWHTNGHWGP